MDWENDGTFDDLGVTGNITHDYGTAGTYTVAIRGDFPRIFFNYTGDRSKILTIEQWGDIQWSSMNSAFSWADNLTENATDAPDLSNVTSMNRMFHKATNFNGDLNNWDVSNVTDMNSLFGETGEFNGNISNWDVSSVTDISFAFEEAKKFNQDLNNWDVSSVENMKAMFQLAKNFNGNISDWDVSSVVDATGMFHGASAFNQNISNWDVSSMEDMHIMFGSASAFNQDLGNWDITSVTSMSSMLRFSGMDVTNYDNTLIGWATQNVKPNISLGADELKYCDGEAARNSLIDDNGWDITGDSKSCICPPPLSIVYVDENANGNNDGTSWDDAYTDLQVALANVGTIDTIWVAEGIYHPAQGTDRDSSFILKNNLVILGGFKAGDTCEIYRDWLAYPTILSGDIGIQGDSTDNSYHVIFNDGGGINATAVIDGFIIENGNADGLGDDEKGGGVFNDNASPTVRNCHFKNNNAKFGGGGMYNKTSATVADNCQYSNNTAGIGGGVFNSIDATTKFTNCYFHENNASGGGGGMFNNSALLCRVINCFFESNSAATDGGGIYNLDSSPDIINSAFLSNSADEGAGVSNRSVSSPNIINSSLHDNEASSYGGGVRNHTGTVPLITNCIIWGNSAGLADGEISNSIPGPIVSYSIIKQTTGVYPGTDNLNVDPLFNSSIDLSLQQCSPAVNAGSNAANGTTEDLVGNYRVFNGTIDMGAYESQVDISLPSIFTGGGDGTSWNDASNWNDGHVPSKCRDILIPSPHLVEIGMTEEAYGKTIAVEVGAELITFGSELLDVGN